MLYCGNVQAFTKEEEIVMNSTTQESRVSNKLPILFHLCLPTSSPAGYFKANPKQRNSLKKNHHNTIITPQYIHIYIYIFFFCLIFWSHHTECKTLVPQPRLEATLPTVEAQSLNRWTARESLSSVQFSHSVVSDSSRPHESQHARSACPSPTPGVHSDSCPSSR